jgi:hypothetical protein
MIWWFLILGLSTAALLAVGISFYVRVRGHMKSSNDAPAGTPNKSAQELDH